MAGNAGAGFTNNFPRAANGSYALEGWVEYGVQFLNGYLRIQTTPDDMFVEAVSSEDGRVFDSVHIPPPATSKAPSVPKLASTAARSSWSWSLSQLLSPLRSLVNRGLLQQ